MSDVTRVSPAEAHELVSREGHAYVDVRTEAEVAEGRPSGAYNVPFQLAAEGGRVDNPEFLQVMRACFTLDSPLVVGCQSGVRSLRAARALVAAGYARVVDQRAGWGGVRSPFGETKEKGWESAGLPTESGDLGDRAYAVLRARA